MKALKVHFVVEIVKVDGELKHHIFLFLLWKNAKGHYSFSILVFDITYNVFSSLM